MSKLEFQLFLQQGPPHIVALCTYFWTKIGHFVAQNAESLQTGPKQYLLDCTIKIVINCVFATHKAILICWKEQ